MKNLVHRVVPALLVCVMCLSTSVFALQGNHNQSRNSQVNANILQLEAALAQEETNVVDELTHMIDDYSSQIENSTIPEDILKLQKLVSTCERLRTNYINAKNDMVSTRSGSGLYDVAIAAVATYFSAKGYYLSNELILHAADSGTRLNEIYMPVLKDRVIASREFQDNFDEVSNKGTGSFTTANGNPDLYYAIHLYNWEKKNGYLILSDRYDFDADTTPYSDIAQVAVNTMYLAQEAGDLTPFYTTIMVRLPA